MASVRIESATAADGQIYAKVFVGSSTEPQLRSEPAFVSEDEFVEQVLKMCREHFPDHSPVSDDPTIGV